MALYSNVHLLCRDISMQKATSFDELQKLTASKFETLNLEMEALSHIFSNVPIAENVKQKLVQKGLKNKAGWYACLVNNNIDILLLPDYFENFQTRNILLKKETEQFQTEFYKFNELKSIESNTSLYENFFNEIKIEFNSYDLFSTQVVKKDECPFHIQKLFENWRKPNQNNILQNIFMQFYAWHNVDNFSFTGNRQILIWLNFKLWKQFGNVAMFYNFEQFLFNQWNKENRNGIESILNFIEWIKTQNEVIKKELKTLFRTEIGFENLSSVQKIANNYLFNQNFNHQINVTSNDNGLILAKSLSKKGFITIDDIPNQVLTEKQITTLQYWVENKNIAITINEDEWTACILPKGNDNARLNKYNNLAFEKETINWEKLANIKPKLKIQQEEITPKIEIPTFGTLQQPDVRKTKAFFG